jgi:hypothetical protein
MGVPIAVVPGLLVTIDDLPRSDPAEELVEILHGPRLELDGGDAAGRPRNEDRDDPGAQAGARDGLLNPGRQIEGVPFPARLK